MLRYLPILLAPLLHAADPHQLVCSAANGQPIAVYQMEAGAVPPGVNKVFAHGAHLHPIYSPSGRVVTGNHPPDHRWHRGVWMAWTKTEFGAAHPDFWNQGKGDGEDKSGTMLAEVRFDKLLESSAKDGVSSFSSQHRFIEFSTGQDVDVLKERWEVKVQQQKLGERLTNVIDLTSTQSCASSTALKLPTYHYGGLGMRGPSDWDDTVVMLTSEGYDRKSGDSTKGRWAWMGGKTESVECGMAILIHPENFRFPQPLRLNPKNPQLCIAPSQGGDWSIVPGVDYVSRYRLLIVDGTADTSWIEAQWKAWAGK
jgi:hypothetical protein